MYLIFLIFYCCHFTSFFFQWRPLAEQLLYLDSILEHKKERIETCKLTNCIATYSSREKLCEGNFHYSVILFFCLLFN